MDERTELLDKYHQMDNRSLTLTHLKVDRPVFPQSAIDETYKRETSQSFLFGVKCFSCKCQKNPVSSFFPITSWLLKYKWEKNFMRDLIAGFTVGIMNIPQGMAYAMLGNVPPVVGLYMSFFPVLIYAFLGTSRHISMGTFAVISLMAGKTVSALTAAPIVSVEHLNVTRVDVYSPIEVASAVTFMVGIFQIVMFIVRLGVITSLLSDTLVSGLTAGAAVHVFTSQIKDLIGIKYPKPSSTFPIISTYFEIFHNLDTINLGATTVSVITMTVLVINNEIIKPRLSKLTFIPLPIELIAVMAGTLLSNYYNLSDRYGLSIVGHIAVGLPEPQMPRFSLFRLVALDSFVIAVIAYIISISMALMFSQKHQYDLDPNQEFLAQGAGNLFGSFFSCLPFSASLSRSLIQETAGGQTQLASIFSSSIILVVLMWIGPFFEPLPKCILASLIVVALKGILFQVKDIVRIWKMSSLDGIIWLSTYLTVIFIEIDVGLVVGMIVSVVVIFIQGMKPYICSLGNLPNTEIYVDSTRYTKTEQKLGVCVIHYAGVLNFVNKDYFRNSVRSIVDEKLASEKTKIEVIETNDSSLSLEKTVKQQQEIYLVLNLSALQYVDPSGSLSLLSLTKELNNASVYVLLSSVPGPVYDTLKTCGVFDDNLLLCYPTIHDAVLFAESKLRENVQ